MNEFIFQSLGVLMIPGVALTLWVMFLMIKMSKRMKKNHPEEGKCELYQVVFKQKSARVIQVIIKFEGHN